MLFSLKNKKFYLKIVKSLKYLQLFTRLVQIFIKPKAWYNSKFSIVKKEPSKRSSSSEKKSVKSSTKCLDKSTKKTKVFISFVRHLINAKRKKIIESINTNFQQNDFVKNSKRKVETKKIPVEIEKRVTELLEEDSKKRTTKKLTKVSLKKH